MSYFSKILSAIKQRKRTKPVFILGTGRSGTHWLARTLATHPQIFVTVEEAPMFSLSVEMALNPGLERSLFDSLVEAYLDQLRRCEQEVYVDKSHPNIWIAEKLQHSFPQALFLGIQRDPYATVASMKRHKGVSDWHARWREFPVPNRFLGISEEIAADYEDLSQVKKLAMRWLAHRDRLQYLRPILAGSLLTIDYEQFAAEPEQIVGQLEKFLQLSQPLYVPEVRIASLTNWQTELSEQEIEEIHEVVGVEPQF